MALSRGLFSGSQLRFPYPPSGLYSNRAPFLMVLSENCKKTESALEMGCGPTIEEGIEPFLIQE